MRIGTARTAYFNWLAAKAAGGEFILRIDDTDAARSDSKYTEAIFKAMEMLGLDYDAVFHQSDRTMVYRDYLDVLQHNGRLMFKDNAYYLRTDDMPSSWKDEIAGDIAISDADKEFIKELVLFKSDGTPTYNFASTIDDIQTGITCVIRGVDHISNTPKQIAIYNALGAKLPSYYHIGLIMGQDGKKLSKRHGASSVVDYEDFHPEALLNLMLRMGWGPTVDDKSTAIITRESALRMFWEGGKMRSSPSKLDADKLKWFDKKYRHAH
jgi:glutamyl-tRNA synthetase